MGKDAQRRRSVQLPLDVSLYYRNVAGRIDRYFFLLFRGRLNGAVIILRRINFWYIIAERPPIQEDGGNV
jgi:hypothetical protein